MATSIDLPTWLVLAINGLVALVSLIFYICVFQFGYLHITRRHRPVTIAMAILGVAYQICVQIHLVAAVSGVTAQFIIIAFASFLMATFIADMHFAKAMIPIAPQISISRLKIATGIMVVLYAVIIARRIAGMIVLLVGHDPSNLQLIFELCRGLEILYSVWGFIVLNTLSVYRNVCVNRYIREKARRESMVENSATSPEQHRDLIRDLKAIRFYSYANVTIDVVALVMSFITYWPINEWKTMIFVGGILFIFHGISYSYLLSHIVRVAFPQSRVVNSSALGRGGIKAKSSSKERNKAHKSVMSKIFGKGICSDKEIDAHDDAGKNPKTDSNESDKTFRCPISKIFGKGRGAGGGSGSGRKNAGPKVNELITTRIIGSDIADPTGTKIIDRNETEPSKQGKSGPTETRILGRDAQMNEHGTATAAGIPDNADKEPTIQGKQGPTDIRILGCEELVLPATNILDQNQERTNHKILEEEPNQARSNVLVIGPAVLKRIGSEAIEPHQLKKSEAPPWKLDMRTWK